jgi:hypothetical protein
MMRNSPTLVDSHLYIQQIIQTFFVSAISGGITGMYSYETFNIYSDWCRSMHGLDCGISLTRLLVFYVCSHSRNQQHDRESRIHH